MCIIIDTNSLANVFKSSSQNHEEFKPVLKWIIEGRGKIVYGGSKYMSEIGLAYSKLFNELRNTQKAVKIDNEKVDQLEIKFKALIKHADFDDQHIVALLVVSGCKLICSEDRRAYPYFRNSAFFKYAKNRPKIYRGRANNSLLIDINISKICKPCEPLSSHQKQKINSIFDI